MDRSPRIAFYGFRAEPCGISRIMLHLMREIAAGGRGVDLLCDLKSPSCRQMPPVDPAWGIQLVHIPDRPSRKAVLALRQYFESTRPQILLANRERANRLALRARGRGGVPAKIAVRIGTNNSVSISRRHLLQRWVRRWSLVRHYKKNDILIAVSQGVARDTALLTGIPENAIHVIRNPTIPPDIDSLRKAPVAHPWFREGAPPVVLAVGRLASPKGFDTLIRAFSVLRKERDCRLVILGEGKLRAGLERLAQSLGVAQDIDLPGFVENPFPYLEKASLFVLSSKWEGSPNVLIEALAVGVPTVSTDCPFGPREILKDGSVAPLVPVGDAKRLAIEMERILENPPDPERLKAAVAAYHPAPGARAYLAALGIEL